MDWGLWKTFSAIAEEGSLSAAARVLGMSPATAGRHIAMLERELGVQLFNRLPDGYVLTLEGESFVAMAEEMGSIAARMTRKGMALSGKTQRVVRISAGNWFSRFLLRQAGRTLAELPGIGLDIINAYAFANLARHDTDIAIRNRKPEHGRVALRRLPDMPWPFTVSEAMWKATPGPGHSSDTGNAGGSVLKAVWPISPAPNGWRAAAPDPPRSAASSPPISSMPCSVAADWHCFPASSVTKKPN